MTRLHLLNNHKKLLQAFKSYQERYLKVGKKPNSIKLLPEDLYHTMRLEGENISRTQAQALFNK